MAKRAPTGTNAQKRKSSPTTKAAAKCESQSSLPALVDCEDVRGDKSEASEDPCGEVRSAEPGRGVLGGEGEEQPKSRKQINTETILISKIVDDSGAEIPRADWYSTRYPHLDGNNGRPTVGEVIREALAYLHDKGSWANYPTRIDSWVRNEAARHLRSFLDDQRFGRLPEPVSVVGPTVEAMALRGKPIAPSSWALHRELVKRGVPVTDPMDPWDCSAHPGRRPVGSTADHRRDWEVCGCCRDHQGTDRLACGCVDAKPSATVEIGISLLRSGCDSRTMFDDDLERGDL